MSAAAATTTPLRLHPAWQTLERHHRQIKEVHLRELFAGDLSREASG